MFETKDAQRREAFIAKVREYFPGGAGERHFADRPGFQAAISGPYQRFYYDWYSEPPEDSEHFKFLVVDREELLEGKELPAIQQNETSEYKVKREKLERHLAERVVNDVLPIIGAETNIYEDTSPDQMMRAMNILGGMLRLGKPQLETMPEASRRVNMLVAVLPKNIKKESFLNLPDTNWGSGLEREIAITDAHEYAHARDMKGISLCDKMHKEKLDDENILLWHLYYPISHKSELFADVRGALMQRKAGDLYIARDLAWGRMQDLRSSNVKNIDMDLSSVCYYTAPALMELQEKMDAMREEDIQALSARDMDQIADEIRNKYALGMPELCIMRAVQLKKGVSKHILDLYEGAYKHKGNDSMDYNPAKVSVFIEEFKALYDSDWLAEPVSMPDIEGTVSTKNRNGKKTSSIPRLPSREHTSNVDSVTSMQKKQDKIKQ